MDPLNTFYSSVDGVLFNKSQTTLLQYPDGKVRSDYTVPNSVISIGYSAFAYCTNLTSVTIPNGVTSIGYSAFERCTSLTNLTIPNSVTNIGNYAFQLCTSLTGVYFQGNAPSPGSGIFYLDDNAIVYYLPGTTGWGATYGGRPTAPWYLPNPLILDFGPSFGVLANQFGFIISWGGKHSSVVVEACNGLANHGWSPVATNTLANGASYFSDPDWTNYPARFYRLRSR